MEVNTIDHWKIIQSRLELVDTEKVRDVEDIKVKLSFRNCLTFNLDNVVSVVGAEGLLVQRKNGLAYHQRSRIMKAILVGSRFCMEQEAVCFEFNKESNLNFLYASIIVFDSICFISGGNTSTLTWWD